MFPEVSKQLHLYSAVLVAEMRRQKLLAPQGNKPRTWQKFPASHQPQSFRPQADDIAKKTMNFFNIESLLGLIKPGLTIAIEIPGNHRLIF
jgi:hypothetical protein